MIRAALPILTSAAPEGPPIVLNLNVPDLAIGELRGLERAHLATYGAVQATVAEIGKGYLRLEYTVAEREDQRESDAGLLAGGYATITPLLSICEATDVELALPVLPELRRRP